ncbi:MAG TPA: hypothetical protein VGB66_14405, partial [Longimicrobium sp.]
SGGTRLLPVNRTMVYPADDTALRLRLLRKALRDLTEGARATLSQARERRPDHPPGRPAQATRESLHAVPRPARMDPQLLQRRSFLLVARGQEARVHSSLLLRHARLLRDASKDLREGVAGLRRGMARRAAERDRAAV